MKEHIDNYLFTIKSLLDNLDRKSVEEVAKLIESAFHNDKRIFIMGNGGSAATASHWANDFSKSISFNKKHLKAMSLTDNVSLMTAIGNDDGYDQIFVNQLRVFMEEGDIVIGISASGNSSNIIKALMHAKEQGARTIGIVGFDGGAVKNIVDLSIHIETPPGLYGPVEDIHLLLDHMISSYIINKLKQIQK